MDYEVEQKFPGVCLDEVRAKLDALGAAVGEPRDEADLYFAHPARDFAVTDEALRIRRVGDRCWITYKGSKCDAATKTRRELELPLPPGEGVFDRWRELFEVLGFRPVAEVRKRRWKSHVAREGREVEVSLDEVAEVGSFVELELVAQAADVEAAKACIASLAVRLGLAGSERRSYLELLLEKRNM